MYQREEFTDESVVENLFAGATTEMLAMGLEEMESPRLFGAVAQGMEPGPWLRYWEQERDLPRFKGRIAYRGIAWNQVYMDDKLQEALHAQFLRRYPRYKNHQIFFVDCRRLETPGTHDCGLRNHMGTHMVTLWRIMT